MITRTCVRCGKLFQAKDGRNKYCSDECKKPPRRGRHKPTKANRISFASRVKIQEDEEWIDKYNESGYMGGNAMLAKEAGMTYEEWMRIPMTIRIRKREEILDAKRNSTEC